MNKQRTHSGKIVTYIKGFVWDIDLKKNKPPTNYNLQNGQSLE